MPLEENSSKAAHPQPTFELGQDVIDKYGERLGKVQARFPHCILVQRGVLFGKAYYIPHSAINRTIKGNIHLSLGEDDLRKLGYTSVPDDLYEEIPAPEAPPLNGVPLFGRGPLSPAETGHYNYGRHSPGMNTDASGSYHREEVLPIPQKVVGDSEEVFTGE
ncbi:MAG TPA: hypothetical protein VKR42_06765 [Ktedonobacteraceae bacterium]|nr:hypothetical protein [Ktedonobacteraceae bacterium]